MHQHEKNHVNESLHDMYVGGVMYDDDPSSYFLNHTRASPVSGFSLLSDGSSSSLFSQNGQSLSDHGSPTPPQLDDSLFGELGLCRNLSKMYISNDQENFGSSSRDFDQIDVEKPSNGFSDFVGIQSPVSMNVPLNVNGDRRNMAFSIMNNFLGSQMYPWLKKDQACTFNQRGNSLSNLSMYDSLIYGQTNGLHWSEGRCELNFHASPRLAQATRAHPNVLGDYTNEDSLIIPGDGINYVINNGLDFSRGLNKSSQQEIGVSKHRGGRSRLDNLSQFGAARRNVKNAKLYNSVSLPTTYTTLAEARGYIYLLAKDQHGCRFLQRLFDEGTREDVEIIFKEIIHHVVELMMNPFGNYLMQKLLEECNEEQRMQILLMATEEPGELVRISLNTHGTRVVQKLIETLKTRQQISVVISALKPGFISLIKDLNGNHVVQRCLQCLSSEDNNFIFVAAAKYCVDIATHQHGCCVLQRCISHSTGVYREKLVEEISTNGLLLAQDSYGNYVVQFVLELKIPSATSTLISQFEGNYVHLSSHKFSSQVVEKCLVVLNDESRSKIIHELLSTTHFEQLLQDPHANYVVQTALRVSEGSLHNSLVEAIECRKAISRNSPYSKRILSQKLLKK